MQTILINTTLVAGLLLASLAHAQQCNPAVPRSTPDEQFQMNIDGTVLHRSTNLTWMRCALGQEWTGSDCIDSTDGTLKVYAWQSALQAAQEHTFAGHSDWRLPNFKELESLVEQGCWIPAINLTAFPSAPTGWFWSSSAYAGRSGGAWGVDFGKAYVSGALDGNGNQGRLVRGGQ